MVLLLHYILHITGRYTKARRRAQSSGLRSILSCMTWKCHIPSSDLIRDWARIPVQCDRARRLTYSTSSALMIGGWHAWGWGPPKTAITLDLNSRPKLVPSSPSRSHSVGIHVEQISAHVIVVKGQIVNCSQYLALM
jgi:hypothetical protein